MGRKEDGIRKGRIEGKEHRNCSGEKIIQGKKVKRHDSDFLNSAPTPPIVLALSCE